MPRGSLGGCFGDCVEVRLVDFDMGRSFLGDGLDEPERLVEGGLAVAFSCMMGWTGAAFEGASPSKTIPLARNLSMTPSG